jgi:hypothetical protein
MELERAKELQKNIAGEALAMLVVGSGKMTKYEQTIQLIGNACGIPVEDTDALLALIGQGKTSPEKIDSGEITLPGTDGKSKDVMANWTAQDTFWVMMDLFQVAIVTDSRKDRETLYGMVEELIATQNFEDWLNPVK